MKKVNMFDVALEELKKLDKESKIRIILNNNLFLYKRDLLINTDLPYADVVNNIIEELKENKVL
jgi:hypothetical protein